MMNIREGMRRLGILLGITGGVVGGCFSYTGAKTVWQEYTEYKSFTSSMASPTMLKIAKAARDEHQRCENLAITKAGKQDLSKMTDEQLEALRRDLMANQQTKPSHYGPPEKHQKLSRYDLLADAVREWANSCEVSVIQVNLNGIKQVTVDKTGSVLVIDLQNGEILQRTDAPHIGAYFGILVFPLLGLLVPWGAVRVLIWVGSGFFAERCG